MNEANTYDARVRAIRVYNQPLLEDFRSWLEQSGLVEKTVKAHVIPFERAGITFSKPLLRKAIRLSATLGRQEGES